MVEQAEQLFSIPSHCPVCNGCVIIKNAFLFCGNPSCPAKLSGSVKVWIKRLGLLNWGESLVDLLCDPDNPKVHSIADLYRLTIDDIAACSSGIKFAKKCYDILHSNKSITLELLIASLNIPNLATATATDIVQAGYDTVDKILSMSFEDLIKIPNIGTITAQQVYSGIQSKRDDILDLSEVLDIKKPGSGPLSGLSFCITGSTSRPRKAIEKDIMDGGGIIKGSVGKGLNYLITNDPDTSSSKMQNAKKYGIKIASESDLYSMMKF